MPAPSREVLVALYSVRVEAKKIEEAQVVEQDMKPFRDSLSAFENTVLDDKFDDTDRMGLINAKKQEVRQWRALVLAALVKNRSKEEMLRVQMEWSKEIIQLVEQIMAHGLDEAKTVASSSVTEKPIQSFDEKKHDALRAGLRGKEVETLESFEEKLVDIITLKNNIKQTMSVLEEQIDAKDDEREQKVLRQAQARKDLSTLPAHLREVSHEATQIAAEFPVQVLKNLKLYVLPRLQEGYAELSLNYRPFSWRQKCADQRPIAMFETAVAGAGAPEKYKFGADDFRAYTPK